MKRRELMGYAGAGLLASLCTNFTANAQSASSLSIKWFGHTCFLFTGSGTKILTNPFKPGGCTAKYELPNVATDLVAISSQLLDEGYVEKLPGSPKLVFEPGIYKFKGMQIQGIGIDHDRKGGRRFGINTAWLWKQAGIKILHLGGAAAPISIEQKILMGRPDVALIPVGGGPKAYNPQEAKDAIKILNPKLIIPTHYRTQAADLQQCNISPLDEFLNIMQGVPVKRHNSHTITIRLQDLPENGAIQVFQL
ncbi:MBL fold metallo-hydrolase [Calothrix rhizosoleniae]|uniref:MBL fold metallo-hydrolase n=1 Tax=Calothrix rhizosoleniae TaxID=888997 RepID=UPI000B498D2C|nr:MBL fold metallo-hydrolase [Calothrix rhizosoleniae]